MNLTIQRELLSGRQAKEYREFLDLSSGAMALLIGTMNEDILEWESVPDEARIPALYSRRIKHAVAVKEAKENNPAIEWDVVMFLPLSDEPCTSVDMALWRDLYQLNHQDFARSLGLSTATARKWTPHSMRSQQLRDEIVDRLKWFVLVREGRIKDVTDQFQSIFSDVFRGKDVRKFRHTFWLTQQDLARILKVSPASIRIWESPAKQNKNIGQKYRQIFRSLIENVLVGVNQDILSTHSPKDLVIVTADAIRHGQDMSKPANNKEEGAAGDSTDRDLPPDSTANYIVESIEAWIRNIRRMGKVRLEDLTKLQADLEYVRGFVEADPQESRDSDAHSSAGNQ